MVTDPAIEAIAPAEREVIGEKVSYRLAQQPGSYVVLKYVRKVVKRRDTQAILTAAAPANVLERSAADVSFPRRDAGRQVLLASPSVSSASASSRRRHHAQPLHPGVLDEPRHRPAGADHRCAECACARERSAVDGRDLDQGRSRGEGQDCAPDWLWPVYGDCDEVVFHYAPSRARTVTFMPFSASIAGTLLSDGY